VISAFRPLTRVTTFGGKLNSEGEEQKLGFFQPVKRFEFELHLNIFILSMNFDEITTSIKAALYDRARSPFFGAFVISWIAWNWQLIYYLLSEDSSLGIFKRIWIINKHYTNWWNNLWLPLISSLFVFIVGSLLTIGFRYLQILFVNFRNEKIEKGELLTRQQSLEAKKELIEYEKRINTTSLDLQRQLESIQSLYKAAQTEIETLKNSSIPSLEDVQLQGPPQEKNEEIERRPIEKYEPELLRTTVKSNSQLNEYETVSSDILKSESGSVFIWALINKVHLTGAENRHRYLLSHSTNNGESIVTGDYIYANAWSISRKTDLDPSKNEWRFWCTNARGEGQDRVLRSQKTLTTGWHLFGVTWSKADNYIKFYIDFSLEDQGEFKFLPENYDSYIYVGTWPNKFKKHFFDSEIGPGFRIEKPLSVFDITSLIEYSKPK